MTIKILLIDDHAILRQGLQLLLSRQDDFLVVGEAGEGRAGIALVKEHSPDIVIMDITMPGLNGIDTTKCIVSEFPATKVIALSIHSEQTFVEDMLNAGAAGYILKESVPEDLVRGIREVMKGGSYLSPSITGLVVNGFREGFSSKPPRSQLKDAILETKLHPPPLSEEHIHRQRLTDVLEKNSNRPIQVITAPAGYGKTTLASCWLSQNKHPYSWIALDERDNNIRQFTSYFLHGINRIFPGSTPKSLELIEEDSPPILSLSTTLINEISAITEDFLLVIDNFHCITEKSVSDLLSEILRHPPKPLHLILIGRTEPFLPLSNLRAHRTLSEIRLHDLRFTKEEEEKYLQTTLGTDLPETTPSLFDKTEGWITGIRLAAISSIHKDDTTSLVEEVSKDDQYVMDYLLHEVLSSQPEQIAAYLPDLSICERFCAPLLDVFWKKDDSSPPHVGGLEFIEWLRKNQLFLIPLDRGERWYRFHQLFQDILSKQLQLRKNKKQIDFLHTTASNWFEENNHIEEAIYHRHASGEIGGAVRLLHQHRHTLHNSDRRYKLDNWLAIFTEEEIFQYPELLICRAWINYHHFEVPTLPATLSRLEELITKNQGPMELLGEVEFLKANILYLQNDASGCLTHLNNAKRILPPEYQEISGAIETLAQLASQMQGEPKNDKTRVPDKPVPDEAGRARLLVAPVCTNILSGELVKSKEANHQLHLLADNNNYKNSSSWSSYFEGLICFYQYDLDNSIKHFQNTLENRHIINNRLTVDALAALTLSYQLQGQVDLAQSALQQLIELSASLKSPTYTSLLQLFQIRLSTLQGKSEIGMNWRRHVPSPTENMMWWIEIPKLSYSRALITDNSQVSLEEAERKLLKIIQLNQEHHNCCQTIQAMVLLVHTYKKLGKSSDALSILATAVKLSESGHWIAPFIEQGQPLKSLLLQLQQETAPSFFTQQLIDSYDYYSIQPDVSGTTYTQETNAQPSPAVLVSNLTTRENEILELLVQGLANKGIAESLFVSVDTVKTHLRNIYHKMGVKSRLQAVAKATATEAEPKSHSSIKQ